MFPFKTYKILQTFDTSSIADPYTETRREMKRFPLDAVRKGETVAVTASSRGIRDILPITQAVVEHFKELDAIPYIVPAMGSHAGGTAEKQERLLEHYGITEKTVGVPIRSSMETVRFGEFEIAGGRFCPVYFDKVAAESDHVFLVNRIKSHTRFSGPIESGLLKMLMIGLGNADGASAYHRAIAEERFSTVIRQVAELLMQKVAVLGGLGIVENAEGSTAAVRAIAAAELVAEEEKLLVLSKKLMPRLPFDEIDLLIIDRIGKNISGTGFDTNVVGRKFNDHKAVGDEKPVVHRIAVCRLTEETEGNANGIGIAEFCLSSLLKEIDVEKTRLNAITADHVSAAMLPLDYATETEIIHAAWESLGKPPWESFRVAWIRDTLHLDEITVSESLYSHLAGTPR